MGTDSLGAFNSLLHKVHGIFALLHAKGNSKIHFKDLNDLTGRKYKTLLPRGKDIVKNPHILNGCPVFQPTGQSVKVK